MQLSNEDWTVCVLLFNAGLYNSSNMLNASEAWTPWERLDPYARLFRWFASFSMEKNWKAKTKTKTKKP